MKPRSVLGCLLNPALMSTYVEVQIDLEERGFHNLKFSWLVYLLWQVYCQFNLKPFLLYFFFRANILFNIWIKYKPRLPEWYYNEKLLKVGDSLAQIKVSHMKTEKAQSQSLFHYVSVLL